MTLWLPESGYGVPDMLAGEAPICKEQYLLQAVEVHCSWHLAAYGQDQAESNAHLC